MLQGVFCEQAIHSSAAQKFLITKKINNIIINMIYFWKFLWVLLPKRFLYFISASNIFKMSSLPTIPNWYLLDLYVRTAHSIIFYSIF